MFRPIHPITGTPFYAAYETSDVAAAIKACSTPEQHAWNARHRTCPACKGQGYHVYKRNTGEVIRENVGCEVCEGLGAIPRSL